MKKIEFRKIESLLEDILNSKTKVIDLIAENGDKINLPEELFLDVEIQNSVFISSKASLFVGLYVELIKEITNIDFDTLKTNTEQDVILQDEMVEDLIIDMGKFVKNIKNKKENSVLKKYKSHVVSLFDLKNILKWFEICKNNKLRIHVI